MAQTWKLFFVVGRKKLARLWNKLSLSQKLMVLDATPLFVSFFFFFNLYFVEERIYVGAKFKFFKENNVTV